jgi:hypothetical protein
MITYKLFRLRKDGTLGPLFINRKQRIEVGKVYYAENHPTKGFKVRPGWHSCAYRFAPHLSEKGRVWCKVEITDVELHARPEKQGGLWYTSKTLKVIEVIK